MTRLTALIIQTRDDVFVEPYQKDTKWGFWITLGDTHRLLISTDQAVYNNEVEARVSGESLLSRVRVSR